MLPESCLCRSIIRNCPGGHFPEQRLILKGRGRLLGDAIAAELC